MIGRNSEDFGFPLVDLPPAAMVSPETVIAYLVDQLVTHSQLRPEDADQVVRTVLQREALGSTAIGRGVALPHGKSDAVDSVVGIIGRSTTGIVWQALDNEPVRFVCLLVTVAERPGESLRALEPLSRRLRG